MDIKGISAEQVLHSPWIDLIDIRTAEERRLLGFIPGSWRAELQDLETLLHHETTSSAIALVCNSGRRAREVLAECYITEDISVACLDGGILAWRERGYPIVMEEEPPEMPSAYKEMDIRSPQQFVTLLRSCFIAEMIEGPMTAGDQDIDPLEIFEGALSLVQFTDESTGDSLENVIDHLAAASRRLGGSLSRIAENTSVMRALLQDRLLESA